jgi:hypothetical protein
MAKIERDAGIEERIMMKTVVGTYGPREQAMG